MCFLEGNLKVEEIEVRKGPYIRNLLGDRILFKLKSFYLDLYLFSSHLMEVNGHLLCKMVSYSYLDLS